MNDPAQLVDVLLAQTRAWGREERPRIEDILTQHPHLASDSNALLDLIYNEVVLREEVGQRPVLSDYLLRFPSVESELRIQFEVDHALTLEELAEPQPAEGSTVPHQTRPHQGIELDWLSGFELLEEVGRGAMGVVWRAWQPSAKRIVALKLLAIDVPIGRVQTEIEAATRLAHPNILPVFEVRQDGGRTALVLEFAEGGNLAKKLGSKPQPPREAARLVETLASAMAHAHARGVVHRDLKPSNVLLSGDETTHLSSCTPRIGDFGLAKLVESDQQLTRTNDILGTPSYMAPEQTGGGQVVGPSADIYSLGAILYECLTGRPPFLGESILDTLEQLRNQDVVPPSRLQPRIPHDLEVICLECLHKAPARRYTSAKELAEDLRRFGAGEPIRARPVSFLERAWKWARRRPAAAALVAVTLAAAVSLLAGGVWANEMLRRQRNLAVKQAEELDERLSQTRRLLYTTQLLRVGAVWPTDPQQGLRLLEDPRACPPDLRCFSWGVLHQQCKRYRTAWPGHDRSITALAVSRDGRRLATGGEDGLIRLWNAANGAPLATLHEHTDRVSVLAFSSDGVTLASGAEDALVKLWDLSAAQSRGTIRIPTGRVAGLAFDPNGKYLAVSHGRSPGAATVELFDVQKLTSRCAPLARDAHALAGIALSPDGDLLACADREHVIRLYRTSTGRLMSRLRGHASAITAIVFAKDGRHLVSASLDGNLRTWNAERENEMDSFDTNVGPITALALHPDGQTIALATDRPAEGGEGGVDLQLWDVLARRGGEPLRAHGGGIGGLAFLPDGKTLITAGRDRAVKTWDHPGRRDRMVLRDPVGRSGSVSLSSDGRLLAWVRRQPPLGPGSVIDVHDLSRGTMASVLRGHGRGIRCVALAGDGATLASAAGEDGESSELLLWETRTGRLMHALTGHTDTVTALAAFRDGRELASAGRNGEVRLWDLSAGKSRLRVLEKEVGFRAVAVGDERFAAGGGRGQLGIICVWNRSDGSLVRRVESKEPVAHLAPSRDGSRIAWAGQGGQVHLMGDEEVIVETGMKGLAWLAFSADGKTLAIAGTGTGVKLCDVASGQERATLPGHRGGACFAGFDEDGRMLVTVGVAGQGRLWHRGE